MCSHLSLGTNESPVASLTAPLSRSYSTAKCSHFISLPLHYKNYRFKNQFVHAYAFVCTCMKLYVCLNMCECIIMYANYVPVQVPLPTLPGISHRFKQVYVHV